MKKLLCAICLCLAMPDPGNALKGGRYDQQVQAATSRILQEGNYKNVHAQVEDGIVTLRGTVKLESARTSLEYKVRHLRNVAGVRNEVVLDPPPVDDKALVGQLSHRLREAGLEMIKIKAHNGAVTLIGVVRTQRERDRSIQTAWSTHGVREVDPQLSVAY